MAHTHPDCWRSHMFLQLVELVLEEFLEPPTPLPTLARAS